MQTPQLGAGAATEQVKGRYRIVFSELCGQAFEVGSEKPKGNKACLLVSSTLSEHTL